MDPTKNFDHLDPKLKDTYARVMGTTPPGATDATQNPVGQPVGDLSVNAAVPAPNPTPQTQFNPTPLEPTTLPDQNTGPNPGTGPTINSIPTDTTTVVATPTAPANSSFFSDTSPANSEPTQPPIQAAANNNISTPYTPVSEPASAPVTPYSPDNQPQYAPPAESTQPLPSPSSVVQNASKQTSPLLRVLYIIAAVIFFAIYTVFWIKVFNLPFLF